MNSCADYKEMMEIDLIDLLYQICRRWRGMVAAILIGAVLGCWYGFAQIDKDQNSAQTGSASASTFTYSGASDLQGAENTTGSAFLDAKEILSEGEIALADNCVTDYIKFYKNYLKTNDYGNNSVYLKLDSNSVPTLAKTYLIEDYYELNSENGEMVTNIHNIVGIYKRMLSDSEVTDKILKTTGLDLQTSHVLELYTIGLVDDSIMRIIVTAGKWADCNKIMKILDEFVDEYTEQVRTLYSFSITPIDQIYYEYHNDSVFSAQQSHISNINTIRGNMSNASSTLNDNQKIYYNAIVSEISAQVGNDIDALDAIDIAAIRQKVEADEEIKAKEFLAQKDPLEEETAGKMGVLGNASASTSGRSFLKYIFLGMLVILFIYCAVISAMYVLSGSLRTKDDMSGVFRLMVFGQLLIRKESKHRLFKRVDTFIDGLFIRDSRNYNEDSTISLISSSIVNALKTNEKKKLYISMGSRDKSAKTLTDKLSQTIAQCGIDVLGCGSILNDTEAITCMTGSDAVLFVEQISKSRYEDIAAKHELCSSYKKPVIGSVVIR